MSKKTAVLTAWSLLGLLVTATSAVPLHARANRTLTGVAAWWGQDNGVSLDEVCGDSSFHIVILSFVNTFFAAGGYPGMNMNYLNGPSGAQTAAGATDLLDGSPLVPAIQKCQVAGKKVFVSLGGGGASSKLSGDSQGQQFADTIWNLFLGGTEDSALRPFQGVTLDGIDLGK
jgi:chitinase